MKTEPRAWSDRVTSDKRNTADETPEQFLKRLPAARAARLEAADWRTKGIPADLGREIVAGGWLDVGDSSPGRGRR